MNKARWIFPFFFFLLSACAKPLPPPDMSSYSTPTKGHAGIYFYQWKTGILGAAGDVKFVFDGKTLGKINTGEYLYFEVPAGRHKYRFHGGLIPQQTEFDFVAGQNYFFRGVLTSPVPLGGLLFATGVGCSDTVLMIKDKNEIKQAIANIENSRYEHGDVD